jgi:hypothetical protein
LYGLLVDPYATSVLEDSATRGKDKQHYGNRDRSAQPIRRHAIFAQVRTGGHFCRSTGDWSDFVGLLDYENSKKAYHEFAILGLPTAARMTKLTMSG